MRRRSSRRRSGIKPSLERSEGELKRKMPGTSANKRTGTNDGKSCGGGVVATPGFLVLMQLQLIGERVMGALDVRSLSAARRACKAMYDIPPERYLGRVFESLPLVELQRVIHRAARGGHVVCVTGLLKTNTATINAVVNSRDGDGYAPHALPIARAGTHETNARACGRTTGTIRARRTHTVCNMHACAWRQGDMRHVTCDMRHAACTCDRYMRHATCDMQHARMRHARMHVLLS